MQPRAPWACLLAGLVFSLGCAQCASPYDYCGPVYAGGPCNTCVVDDRMGSAFTGGDGMYEGPIEGEMGDVYYDEDGSAPIEEESPYDRPYEGEGESLPPSEGRRTTEPTPADEEPPVATPPTTTPSSEPPLEPPTFESAPETILPPPGTGSDDALPPLEAPPSEGRRTSYTAPAKAKAPIKSAAPQAPAKPKATEESAEAPKAEAAAAANAPAKAKTWQAAGSKGRYRR